MKSDTHVLSGNKKSSIAIDLNDHKAVDNNGSEKEKIFVEAYVPVDPGPYPQDQPKQNSVKFTSTQVLYWSYYSARYTI